MLLFVFVLSYIGFCFMLGFYYFGYSRVSLKVPVYIFDDNFRVWQLLAIVIFIVVIYIVYYYRAEFLKKNKTKLAMTYCLVSLILVFIPPFFSNDVYRVIALGRLSSIYHENSYKVAPFQYPDDMFTKQSEWRNQENHYGPVWYWVGHFLTKSSASFPQYTMIVFKMFAFLINTLSVVLVYLVVKKLAPGCEIQATYLYAFNPWILIEFINNAHNDYLMIFFGILGIYFFVYRKRYLVIPLLIVSGLVKYVYFLLVPIALVELVKKIKTLARKIQFLLVNLLLGFLIVYFAYKDIWAGRTTFKSLFLQSQIFLLPYANIFYIPFVETIKDRLTLFFIVSYLSRFIFRPLFFIGYLINLINSKKTFLMKGLLALVMFIILFQINVRQWDSLWLVPFLIFLQKSDELFLLTITALIAYPMFNSVGFTVFYIILPAILIFKLLKTIKEKYFYNYVQQ